MTDALTPPCPQCGGVLYFDTATTIEEYAVAYHRIDLPIPTRERRVIVAACAACEWLIEIRKG